MKLIDSHCHFDFPDFDLDRAEQLALFEQIGGRALILAGVTAEHWPRQLGLCADHKNLFCALGFHPMFKHASLKECEQQLVAMLPNDRVVAVGESGLDKHSAMALSEQLALLRMHLRVANQFRLPIILHCRGYANELLRELKATPPLAGGVLHAFSGSYNQAMQFIECGLKLGVGGVISYERAKKTRSAISRLPVDALLLESDAPDMPLAGAQGERNTSLSLLTTLQTLAELRGQDETKLAEHIYQNTLDLFSLTL